MARLCLTLRKRSAVHLLLTLLATFGITSVAHADVRVASVFGDHMVLQQKKPIVIWGWADAQEHVQVTLGQASATTTTDEDGKWRVELPALDASDKSHELVIAGNSTVKINDVLIGEVWLCSGQSNMEWSVRSSSNAKAEIADGDQPLIRHIKVPRRPSTVPLNEFEAEWQVCSPDTVANFTAVGYFMARRLQKDLGVPIGLVNASWGGTRVEPWTPPIGFQSVEALSSIHSSILGRTPGTDAYRKSLGDHINATSAWLEKARTSLENSTTVAASPTFPSSMQPYKSHQDPTMLYNGMLHAIVGFPIRGAIWYQGESNHGEGMLYFEKKKALIGGWRKLWGQGDFPFYYVQIAPYQYGNEDPTVLARFWEAQAAVEQVPNTAMVVINDIATLNDIHPPNKQDVGNRLALWALKRDYGRDDVVAEYPTVKSVEPSGNQLRVTFAKTAGGLKTRDGKPPTHFEVIGKGSRGFVKAEAKIDGDSVVLHSDQATEPSGFRFAWHKLAEPNLTGGTGLPVGACRGGNEPDFLSLIDVDRDYQLVYELDLANLGSKIKYDVNKSANVDRFDRVGYLLHLESADRGDQRVFVSMDAFTDDIKKIGIPVAASQAHFRTKVNNLDVLSNTAAVTEGNSISTGNIEFWPNNYGQQNGAKIPGASSGAYDFGDQPSDPVDGYGCMQIHNHGAKETVLAINHWSAEGNADIGIGNSSGSNRDWTFSGNAKNYTTKKLQIYVRAK